jgi:hypothetical protein
LGKLKSGSVLCLFHESYRRWNTQSQFDESRKFLAASYSQSWLLLRSKVLSTIGLGSGFLSRNYERERKCG